MPADIVYREFGPIRNVIARPPMEQLTYTDDTQMMIGLAEALLADGEVRQASVAARFAANLDPGRGYGPGTRTILEAMRRGMDWESMSESLLPGGSFGNGAAMRVAPVALLFHRDPEKLLEQAALSSRPTHRHPLGIEGAVIQAMAIAYALNHAEFNHEDFFAELIANAASDEFRSRLEMGARLTQDDTLGWLGNGIEAHRSVPSSIACFALNPDSYPDTLARAIALGGDVDTLAAMAGAISGARLGIDAIPQNLAASLENGPQGRDYIITLAERLWRSLS